MPKSTLFLLDNLVIDERLYPRKLVNNMHVNDLVRAFQARAEIPPIVVAHGCSFLIDGRHRVEAARKLAIPALPAEIRKYPDEASMLEEAIWLNVHGQPLSHYDQAHCVILAKEVGLSRDRLAVAMSTTTRFVEELWTQKTAYFDGELVAIKRPLFHLAQQPLTPKQFSANEKSNGIHAFMAASQLVTLIDGEIIDWENGRLVEKLQQLYIRLTKAFGSQKKEAKNENRSGKAVRARKKA